MNESTRTVRLQEHSSESVAHPIFIFSEPPDSELTIQAVGRAKSEDSAMVFEIWNTNHSSTRSLKQGVMTLSPEGSIFNTSPA
jgi:hypothetical protein